eukprot:4848-Eustigmatos_ZCMA.PRE.1
MCQPAGSRTPRPSVSGFEDQPVRTHACVVGGQDLYATQGSKVYYANGQNWTSGVNAINNVEQ